MKVLFGLCAAISFCVLILSFAFLQVSERVRRIEATLEKIVAEFGK